MIEHEIAVDFSVHWTGAYRPGEAEWENLRQFVFYPSVHLPHPFFFYKRLPKNSETEVLHREFCRLRILLLEYCSTFTEVLGHRRKQLVIAPFPPVSARQGRVIGLLGIAQHIGKSVFYGYV